MTLLETFQAFWETTRDGLAYLSIKTQQGEILEGVYRADWLANLGCRERRRFIIRTWDDDGRIELEIEPIPDIELSAEEERKIAEEIARNL